MARTLFDCVGDWFEGVIQAEFPNLRKVNNERGTKPDFESTEFYAEAKTGFWDYGVQLKEAQVKNFESDNKPLVYIIGYHTAAGLRNATERMAEEEIDNLLQKQAGLHSVYIISNEIIRRIWAKENHTAANHPEWNYFSVRPRHLDAIIHNKPFNRRGVRYMPSQWYRIRRSDFALEPAPPLGGRTTNLRFGAILHRETDKPVIDYLTKRGLPH